MFITIYAHFQKPGPPNPPMLPIPMPMPPMPGDMFIPPMGPIIPGGGIIAAIYGTPIPMPSPENIMAAPMSMGWSTFSWAFFSSFFLMSSVLF